MGVLPRELALAVHGQVPANGEVGWSLVHGTGRSYRKDALTEEVVAGGLADAMAEGTRAVAERMAFATCAADVAAYLLAWDWAASGRPFAYPAGRALATLIAAGLLAVDGDERAAAVLEEARSLWRPAATTDERIVRVERLVLSSGVGGGT